MDNYPSDWPFTSKEQFGERLYSERVPIEKSRIILHVIIWVAVFVYVFGALALGHLPLVVLLPGLIGVSWTVVMTALFGRNHVHTRALVLRRPTEGRRRWGIDTLVIPVGTIDSASLAVRPWNELADTHPDQDDIGKGPATAVVFSGPPQSATNHALVKRGEGRDRDDSVSQWRVRSRDPEQFVRSLNRAVQSRPTK